MIQKEEPEIKYLDLEDQAATEKELQSDEKKKSIKDLFLRLVSFFIPVKNYLITPILINCNILIFALMVYLGVDVFSPNEEDLIFWGANFRPLTLDGQWWRLFTNYFLHFGFFHLLMNMIALVYIGLLLEPILGKLRFLYAYLLSGLMASIISLWWHDFSVSAGASGAIFGLYGVFLVLLTTEIIEETIRKKLLSSIAIFVAYNLITGLKGEIDNAAHIGGLLAGLSIGYVYTFNLDSDEIFPKIKIIGILTAIFTSISVIICSGLTNDMEIYSKKMQDFVDMENMALEIYSRARYEDKETLLYNIKDRGIYYWNENINLINEIDKLNLPKEIHRKNAIAKRYCELRIKSFRLIYKAISEDTEKYKTQIQKYDQQIQLMIEDSKSK